MLAAHSLATYSLMGRPVPRALLRSLSDVDWDFADAPQSDGIHTVHAYPAKFIPQIPRQLIEILPPGDDQWVMDPFCGSGTTLVEAQAARVSSIGVDLHPLATLISRVKTTPLADGCAAEGRAVAIRAQKAFTSGGVTVPDIPRLDHWFVRPVQLSLAALISEIDLVGDIHVRDALRVAFSSIVVRVSNQDSDTRYAAVQKRVSVDDVWTNFERAVVGLDRALKDHMRRASPLASCRVVTHDLTTLEPDAVMDKVGLVVTSPPYPNAYEYWLYHKYRMYWLGFDPIAVREREIGARPHFFKKKPHTEHDFGRQMGACFRLLARVMVPGSFACFLVGDSLIHGRLIDNSAILRAAATPLGFETVAVIDRTIPRKRKSFNPVNARISSEKLVVFQVGDP